MANKQIRREIYITANGKVAEDVLKALDTYAQKLDKDIEKLIKDGKADTKECKEMVAVRKSLSKQMKDNISDTQRIDKVMKDLAGSSTRQLRSALNAVRREIEKTSEADGRLDGLRKQFKAIKKQIDKNTGAANQHGSAWKTALKNLTAYVGFFGAFKILKQHLTDIIRLNFKLSDQLADIRKVSGWAMEDVDALSKRLAKIDTRNSIQQLNDLAYQGAKLGIGKYGVDGLTRFAEATAQIRMALHEDMGDEAIAQLAKMAEVMHDMESMGVSKALLASGSAIFKLGATTTATGSNIMEFSKRLLGLGKTADLTTPQILALGSAADSMALMPEVASTAFNKFITTLQSKYAQVAQAVGMNQERLKSLLDQHKTMDAIVEVLEHMRDMGDLNALAPIMGDLGSEGARLTNVFASMASNVQMLKDHLATSTEEFEKATAVTAEFDIQNETAQALMERASNIWEKTFVNSENAAGGIKDVARAWYDMTKAITESGSFLLEAGLSLKVLLWSIQALIGAIPALINGLIYLGVVKAASWGGWSVMFNAAAASATRFGTSLANLVGIQTAAQKSAIAAANDHIADAEAMMLEAAEAVSLAREQALLIGTEEELTAMKAAEAAATADLVAAQQLLATTIGEAAAATGGEVTTMLADSQAKTMDAFATRGLSTEELFFAESEGVVTAATTAQTAAIERDTAAKATNTATSKNLKLAWGALIVIGLVAVIDKLYENFKKLNEQEEKNKEITDKIANGLATANQEYDEACKNLKVLFGELERNWKIEDERKRLIGEVNSRYGEYIGNIVTEQTEVGNLTKSYNDATDALKEYYFYKQKEALKADLVAEPKHEAEKSLMKLQQMDFEDNPAAKNNFGNRQFLLNAIEDMYKGKKDSNQAAQELWRMMTGESVPGNFYTDLSKIPLVGGMFPKDTFRSDAQEAMSYLYDVTKQYYSALNNDALIEHNFPGEWKAPERPNKNSKNNSTKAEKPEDDARANISEFITKIENYYERQMTATMEELTAKGIEKELQDQAVRRIQKRKEAALAAAKQAIVLGTEAWNEFSPTLDTDLKEKPDEYGQSQSLMLKDAIQSEDVKRLRADLLKQMPKIKKGKIVGMKSDESDRAYLDRKWLEASKSERKEATIDQKQMEQRRKELMEHDYTGIVQQNSFLGLINAGFANVDLANLEADKQKVFEVLEKGRNDLVGLFETGGDKDKLLKFLFGEDYATSTPAQFADVLTMSEDEVELFYHKLIQYSDEYTLAEKKKQDERKKVAEFLWKYTGMEAAQQARRTALKQVNQGTERFREAGQGRDSEAPRSGLMGGSAYMEQFSYNPNIEQSKLEIELLKEKIKRMQEYGVASEEIADLQSSLAEKQDAYILTLMQTMKERMDAVYGMFQPIEDFGTAAGEAFATMTEDAQAGRDAFKAAVGDMIKAMMKQTVQMTEEYIKRRMMQKVNDKLVSTEIKKSTKEQTKLEEQGADATSAITEAAGQAKVLLTSKVGDEVTKAVTEQTQQTSQISKQAAMEDVQTESAKTQAEIPLGIAGGAAKTIGSLGWWGIPLIAVITALLNGLLGFAMGKVSSLFGGGNKSADTTKGPNTKLVSGMLTYDQGNVQDLKPFFDKDGNMYWATEDNDRNHDGINLLTKPTATTINGAPSLVAEQGPELVIGRETTQAIMQNNPALLKALYQYDKHHSGRVAYDAGNLTDGETSGTVAALGTVAMATQGAVTIQRDPEMLALMTALLARLNEPITASINMYGRGGLYEQQKHAQSFMKGK